LFDFGVGALGYRAGIGDRAEQAMARRVAEVEVLGPWSLETSRRFWEGFTPAALPDDPAEPGLRTVYCVEGDWRRAEAAVTQAGNTARMELAGEGDLDTAAAQACRFLALDVDGRCWPEVGGRDAVIANAQARLPGLRPCGFHSPYEPLSAGQPEARRQIQRPFAPLAASTRQPRRVSQGTRTQPGPRPIGPLKRVPCQAGTRASEPVVAAPRPALGNMSRRVLPAAHPPGPYAFYKPPH
jgi:hypothetical protein